jgi:lipoate-protein ligase A
MGERRRLIVLSYVNDSCVVIGRNQNCLRECNLYEMFQRRVRLARRSSGGGAVYHDHGNVCFCFFTTKKDYNPERTVALLKSFLVARFNLSHDRFTSSERHDLFLDGKKITGSAMRVTGSCAFHHCTLLVSSSRGDLSAFLKPSGTYSAFKTAAIDSIRSPVTTLSEALLVAPSPSGAPCLASSTRLQREALSYFHVHGEEFLRTWKEGCRVKPFSASEYLPYGKFITNVTGLDGTDPIPIIDAGGKERSRGDHRTFQEHCHALQSIEWLLSMPKFTTTVVLPLWEELQDVVSSPQSELFPVARLLMLDDVAAMTDVLVEVRTTVEAMKISLVEVAVSVRGEPVDAATQWIQVILQSLVHGERADLVGDMIVSCCARFVFGREDGLCFQAALDFCFLRDLKLLIESADPDGSSTALLLRAVVRGWERRNNFSSLAKVAGCSPLSLISCSS